MPKTPRRPHPPSPNGPIGAGAGDATADAVVAGEPAARTSRGRFAAGNSGGPGNPHARAVGQLRAAMMASITPQDVSAVVAALVAQAKAGEPWAVRELLDRVLGKPEAIDLLERLDDLERATGASRHAEA